MRKTIALLLIALASAAAAAWADSSPLPKDVIKPKEAGAVPTAVWLAECQALFDEFLGERSEVDATAAAGGYAGDPRELTRALSRQTIPAAQAVADFCSAYVPDTAWGRQLRLEVIDAVVSSLAGDAHIIEMVEGQVQSEVPLAEMLAEQKEISDALIAEVHGRFLNAPKKYRARPEELAPSREYYFQNFHRREHPE
jgi:hypothetical protein